MKKVTEKGSAVKLEFLELEDGEKAPDAALYVLDKSFKVIGKKKIDARNGFNIPEKEIKAGHLLALGPNVENPEKLDRKLFTVYRGTQLKELVESKGTLTLRRKNWLPWLNIELTVSGSVKHCYPWPVLYQYFQQNMVTLQNVAKANALPELAAEKFSVKALDWKKAYPYPFLRMKCEPVCDAVVEVYRRNCCCGPWIIYDPRLPRLVEELERVIELIPEIPWPPEPDPGPYLRREFFKEGAVDEVMLNAVQDLTALKTLPAAEIPLYIEDRRYLHRFWCCCCCTPPVKVAQGFLRPDGTFEISWIEPLRLMLINCHDEYAYKVKQNIDGNMVTIYNGLCAGQWFNYGDDPVLRSYHPDAYGCGNEEFHEAGPFALLQDIGLTGSFNLKTPDSTGWDRVATPADYNHGLCFPASSQAAAKGKYLDRNWGGTLRLRYHFSEELKALGAKYYRVSVVKADSNGNPTGNRTYLNTHSWRYYEVVGTDINVEKVALGPQKVGTEGYLQKIPYGADRTWHSGQYHALLDTTKFDNDKHLLTLEIFTSTGKLMRPKNTPDPGGSTDKNFFFRRWEQETGPTVNVPFAGLTHCFRWDNRKATALIQDFRVKNIPSTNECQFRSGDATDKFSCGYRAYHPEPLFLLDHRLWWRRGMGSPYASGYLSVPSVNPDNVGTPPAAVHVSGTSPLSTMLGSSVSGSACTFTMNLHVNVKTFNGIGTLNSLDAWDQGSFALSID